MNLNFLVNECGILQTTYLILTKNLIAKQQKS